MTTTTSSTAASGGAILTALNAGSGIDAGALVTNLVSASFDPKTAALKTKEDLNVAKVSALATLSGSINSFATALQSLVSGGTLKSQPSSSNPAILTATASGSASIADVAANLEVAQIAQGQSLVSDHVAGSTAPVGLGSLKLTTGPGTAGEKTFDIAIDSTNNTLAGLAKAINATNSGANPSGVSASIISDASGARIVIKGATGAANNFTFDANSDASADLARFASSGTDTIMTTAQPAKDAIVRIDGVESRFSTNTVSNLIDGVTLKLGSAQPGTTVSLGVARPTSAITQAVNDFAAAYNELKTQIDSLGAAATSSSDAGALYGSTAVREMQRQLSKITSSTLTTLPGGPQSLAEIGVSTGRDGTLSVNSTKLASALSQYPDAVEAMFNPAQRSSNPLVKITSAMGATKPGTYTVSGLVAGPPPSGMIGGKNALPSPSNPNGLVASVQSTAPGLGIEVLGDVGSATITVDAGISGVLQSIRDSLQATKGPFKALGDTLSSQKKTLEDARIKLENQQSAYKDQLSNQFSAMQTRVNAYKSIQSYMQQQIDAWSKG